MADLVTLARLQAQLGRGLAGRSEIVDTGTFRLHLWPHGDLFYRNIATPMRRPPRWDGPIAELVERFAALGRSPRLEFFEELWPDLPTALEIAGLRCDQRAVAMVLDARRSRAADGSGATRLTGEIDDLVLRAFIARAEQVFAMPERQIGRAEVDELRRELAAGRTITAVVVERERPVAAASLIGADRDAELAGVWTAPSHRRRGLAAACCRRVVADFAAAGGELVWLSAPGLDGERLYRRLGFVPVGTQLNYAW